MSNQIIAYAEWYIIQSHRRIRGMMHDPITSQEKKKTVSSSLGRREQAIAMLPQSSFSNFQSPTQASLLKSSGMTSYRL